jgi:hypothetical protein
MRKSLVLLGILATLALLQLLNSCKHEFAGNRCQTDPLSIALTHTDATINQNNGTIRATAIGGSGFRYSLNGGAWRDSGYFTGLQAFQSYTVKVTNSWGCMDSANATINVYDPCAGITVVVTATKTDATINQSNGTITASATGGTGFTYSLNGGTYQASGNFTGLAAGNYTITAKNSNGCTGVTQVTIGSVDPCAGVTVVVTATKVDPTSGQSNGSITASATGGSGFTYSLNGGAYQASGTFTGLAAGNYTVTAKNSNGCTGSIIIALGTTNPCNGVTITVTLTKVDPTTGQSNGSITASASGGTGFTYSLNGGAFQASPTFTGLPAGTYTVTAKSSAGCIGTAQITLVGTNPCSGINIVITTTIVTYTPCTTPATGKITVTASGSTGFTYNLNGGAYQASNVFSGLAAGTYTVGAKDLNGCTNTASAVVGTTPKGPLFNDVRTLISTRCSGSSCHLSGQSQAGYNFDNDCSIITYWSQINQSAVTYTLTRMPKSPQPLLNTAEKAMITNWINAGHRYTD